MLPSLPAGPISSELLFHTVTVNRDLAPKALHLISSRLANNHPSNSYHGSSNKYAGIQPKSRCVSGFKYHRCTAEHSRAFASDARPWNPLLSSKSDQPHHPIQKFARGFSPAIWRLLTEILSYMFTVSQKTSTHYPHPAAYHKMPEAALGMPSLWCSSSVGSGWPSIVTGGLRTSALTHTSSQRSLGRTTESHQSSVVSLS